MQTEEVFVPSIPAKRRFWLGTVALIALICTIIQLIRVFGYHYGIESSGRLTDNTKSGLLLSGISLFVAGPSWLLYKFERQLKRWNKD